MNDEITKSLTYDLAYARAMVDRLTREQNALLAACEEAKGHCMFIVKTSTEAVTQRRAELAAGILRAAICNTPQEPDEGPWEAVFTPGNIKAWRIVRRTGDDCWTEYPGNVVAECISEEDGETKLFTADEVASMLPGLDVEAGGWTVQCRLVSREWLNNLPDHEGW